MSLKLKQQAATEWFTHLRDIICAEFEAIEQEYASSQAPKLFERKPWQRDGGGGGTISSMRGRVFEKVGVNISTVHGQFDSKFSKEIPGASDNPNFWASGISLVAHMANPHVPAVHMNTRFICTTKTWFGGGADLTPCLPNKDDENTFHDGFKNICNKHDEAYYPKFKKACDEYFYLPHRGEARGVGGIFYDYLNNGHNEDASPDSDTTWQQDFAFTQDVGRGFLDIYAPIIRANMHKKWDEADKKAQLHKRGRYVEFNLLHDRGTRFGIMTGGNPEAVLMSMPPMASW